jgi:hypothetical protein
MEDHQPRPSELSGAASAGFNETVLERLEAISTQLQHIAERLDQLGNTGEGSSYPARITDFDLPFFALVGIIAKIALASVPTVIGGGAVLILLTVIMRTLLGWRPSRVKGSPQSDARLSVVPG